MARRNFFDTVGASSLSPTLIYSLDLTAQGNVGAISVGNFTVSGKQWTFWAAGGGFADPTCALTSADGLKLTADPAGSSLGGVILPLSQIGTSVTDVLWRRRVVVTGRVEMSMTGGAANKVGMLVAMDGVDLTGWNNWSQIGNKLNASGWFPTMRRAGVQFPTVVNTVPDDLADDVMALTLFDSGSFAMSTGAWSSGYPSPSAMREHGVESVSYLGQPADALPTASDVGIGAVVYADGASTGTVKLKHLKVEVY